MDWLYSWLIINIVFLMHFHKMRLLLWIFKHCAKSGVSLMYMYVIGIQECLKEFGRCCNLSIKVGFWLVKSIVMMKVLERRRKVSPLMKALASFSVGRAVSKGQFVSRDTLHVSKLEFDCQTCGWKKAPCFPLLASWVDKRTFFCQLRTCSHLEINPLTSKEERKTHKKKGLSFWEMTTLMGQE